MNKLSNRHGSMWQAQASRLAFYALVAAGSTACNKAATSSDTPLPTAFDNVARSVSSKAYKLTDCVRTADDAEKLQCYGALGFKNAGDVEKVEAMAGARDIAAGRAWELKSVSAYDKEPEAVAYLIFPDVKTDGVLPFKNASIHLRCFADRDGPKQHRWGVEVNVQYSATYPDGKPGNVVVDVDGTKLAIAQTANTSFYVEKKSAEDFGKVLMNGKSIAMTGTASDGRTGSMSSPLPDSTLNLKSYFAKVCP